MYTGSWHVVRARQVSKLPIWLGSIFQNLVNWNTYIALRNERQWNISFSHYIWRPRRFRYVGPPGWIWLILKLMKGSVQGEASKKSVSRVAVPYQAYPLTLPCRSLAAPSPILQGTWAWYSTCLCFHIFHIRTTTKFKLEVATNLL